MTTVTDTPLLDVRGLSIEVRTDAGWTTVVEEVSFEIGRGRTLGLVGESGSGKSLTAQSLMRLLPEESARISGGSIVFDGTEITTAGERSLQGLRGSGIAMIFQEPMTSLNPAFTVGHQIAEGVRRHLGLSRKQARARAIECLQRVEISDPARVAVSYPHQLSGGMRQRAMIAMAISSDPQLLIADEPTTALDVTIQAQILDLMARMSRELDLSILMVSHDFGVISEVCDDVMVMYAGHTMEQGPAVPLFDAPQHPYLAALLSATPSFATPTGGALPTIEGRPPTPGEFPVGCRFAPRCAHARPECDEPVPLERTPDRKVRCVRHARLDLEVVR